MKNKLPFISVITVNYNGKRYLEPLFDSLYKLNYPKNKLEIIMVDNCSSDDSVEFVKDRFSKVIILKNDLNNYCKANNLGIRIAKGKYIALINNDLKLDKDWLIELIKVIDQDENIGAVTSRILFPDKRLQGTGHYELPNFYWTDRGFKEEDKGQYDKIEEVPSISHCAILYRKKLFEDIGLLDEDFNMYMEDVDMSISARQKGWRLFYTPKSIAYHKFHGSIGDEEANFYCEKNRLLLIAKHYPEKLNEAIFGKGYFNVPEENKPDRSMHLNIVLPDLIKKILKHHNVWRIESILSNLFISFKKIIDLDKHRLVQRLDYEMNKLKEKEDTIELLKKDIANITKQKEEELQEHNFSYNQKLKEKEDTIELLKKDIENITKQNDERLGEVTSSFTDKLKEKEDTIGLLKKELEAKDAVLMQKGAHISYLNKLLCLTRDELLALRSSKGYFFCDFLRNWRLSIDKREFKRSRDFKILVIKPQRISVGITKKTISQIKQKYPDAKIALMANLPEQDYIELSDDDSVDLRLFYSPVIRKFSNLEVLKLILQLNFMKFNLAIVLMDKPYYPGYRRAKLLVALSSAKRQEEYFVGTDYSVSIGTGAKDRIKKLKGLFRDILFFVLNEITLFLIVSFFLIFVVTGIKLRRVTYKIKNYFLRINK